MLNRIQNIINNIKESGKYGERETFTKQEIQNWEKEIQFQFPEEYKILVTTIEPEISNFYFIKPYRHPEFPHYIIFAEWNNDKFAFNEKDSSIITLLDNDDSGKKWKDFFEWIKYVWNMSNKPINPE